MKIKHILTICAIVFFSNIASSQTPLQKAIFIYNICNYIDWPASYSSGNFIIGVIDATEMKDHLEMLAESKTINGRKITVVEFADVQSIAKCHVLYLGNKEIVNLLNISRNPNTKHSLFLSTDPNGINYGSCVNFIINNGKLEMELSKTNTAIRGLKIDPKLEVLASKVY